MAETIVNSSTAASAKAAAAIQSPRRRRILLAANIGVAMLFLIELAPGAARYGSILANILWMMGAAPMVVLSLMRIPPMASRSDVQPVIATSGMVLLAVLMAPQFAAGGLIATFGKGIELIAVVFSQLARLYLGRRFGLLPANRGIVRSGPFRFVRHPIYLGWIVLSIGFVMVYPTIRNAVVLALTLPFMIWRIVLEEDLLNQDGSYREYRKVVRYRLFPGIY